MIEIPGFRLPALAAAAGRRLPQWPHGLALAGALNLALGRGLLSLDEIGALDGQPVRIRVLDAGASADVVLRGDRFRAAPASGEAVLTLSATVSAFLQMLTRQEDPDTLFFHRRLSIEGDTELGLLVKNLLDRVELPALLRLRENP
ncbi:MAG: SCP2 sterol-binding domain-containing protein [Burkholderiaceae bacterium]